MRLPAGLLCLLCILAGAAAPADRPDPSRRTLRRIAFGSCSDQEKPQPIWDAVLRQKPHLFLFLGDNIYGDTVDMRVLRAKYAKMGAIPGVQRLFRRCPVMATWDDHDYGRNDAGVEYPKKVESQQIFLEFFREPKESDRWRRPGVYEARVFGPPGKRVQVILLDTRTFRSPLVRGQRGYVPVTDPAATLLGEEQWRWLGEQLRQPAELRLLGSSIQMVAEDHGSEKWMNIPHERERFLKLLDDTRASGLVVLSGDRHLAELSQMPGAGYPLFDLTSSGLNRGALRWRATEVNRRRVATMPWGDNFGLVSVDWERADPEVRLQVRDVEGHLRIQEVLPLSLLRKKLN